MMIFALSEEANWSGSALFVIQYVKFITKTRLFKYIENFTTKKIEYFQIKNPDIFHISVQNIDCGYSLELPLWGSLNEYHNLCFEQK